MKKLTLALAFATTLITARNATANSDFYMIAGNTCISVTPGFIPFYHPQWGAQAPSNSMINVVCPIALPPKSYTSITAYVSGYNRVTNDPLTCTFTVTDYAGLAFAQRSVILANKVPGQFLGTTVPVTGTFNLFSINCRIPVGENYLTGLEIIPNY